MENIYRALSEIELVGEPQSYVHSNGTVLMDADSIESDIQAIQDDCHYALSEKCITEKDYDMALQHALQVATKDNTQLLTECHYNIMLQCVEIEDWDKAFSSISVLDRYAAKYDLKPYRLQIYKPIIDRYIEEGSLKSCQSAQELVKKLEDEYGETQEIGNISKAVETAIIAEEYRLAGIALDNGNYSRAIELYGLLGDYKDSTVKRYEAMYAAVNPFLTRDYLDNGAFTIMKTEVFIERKENIYLYARTLADADYRDSKELFDRALAKGIIEAPN